MIGRVFDEGLGACEGLLEAGADENGRVAELGSEDDGKGAEL